MTELQRVLAALDDMRWNDQGDLTSAIAEDAARVIRELSAEVERWRDPESDERQKLMEEIILSLGDGARSEVELREGQLDATEAALAHVRADLERVRDERNRFLTALASVTAESEQLKQERDEAIATRETYAMTARQDIIEKAKALDELEAWLREDSVKLRRVSSIEPHEYEEGIVEMYVELNNDDLQSALAPTLAAAIRAALEKARAE